jgi:ribosomal protein L37AE/L43A
MNVHKMRDDFLERTKRVIQDRAGNRCSNPECRVLTSGPNGHPERSTKTGVAAHITAAAPGGARFNSHLTSEQRRSAENGIWLCQTCAHFVDTDYLNYPVELLYEWKSRAEREADDEVKGRKAQLPTPNETENEAREGWVCPFCGTVVELGKTVCLGCQAEVVLGLTRHERQEVAKTGMMIGGGLAFAVLFVIPNWLKSSYGWNTDPFWGLGIYGFAFGAILAIISGGIAVRWLDERRRKDPPRFFRHTFR